MPNPTKDNQNFKNWKIQWRNGKAGFVDSKGNVKIGFQYDDIRPFSDDGLAGVEKNGKEFYIDEEGNYVKDYK